MEDMLIALLFSLQDNNEEIKLSVSQSNDMFEMKNWTETFWSEYGYYDPCSTMSEDDIVNLTDEDKTE